MDALLRTRALSRWEGEGGALAPAADRPMIDEVELKLLARLGAGAAGSLGRAAARPAGAPRASRADARHAGRPRARDVSGVVSSDWFATRDEAVPAALRAGVAKARNVPTGLLGEEAGEPEPE